MFLGLKTKQKDLQTEPNNVSTQIINMKFYSQNLPIYIILIIIITIITQLAFTESIYYVSGMVLGILDF